MFDFSLKQIACKSAFNVQEPWMCDVWVVLWHVNCWCGALQTTKYLQEILTLPAVSFTNSVMFSTIALAFPLLLTQPSTAHLRLVQEDLSTDMSWHGDYHIIWTNFRVLRRMLCTYQFFVIASLRNKNLLNENILFFLVKRLGMTLQLDERANVDSVLWIHVLRYIS